MDTELEQKIVRIVARHDQYLRRASRMLAAAARGEGLPGGAEFHGHELKSLDSSASDLAVELSGSMPSEEHWTPPVRFAYKYGYARPGVMTWLGSFEQGLRISKNYFESFMTSPQRVVHVGDNITVGAANVVMGSHSSARDITTHGDINQQNDDPAALTAIAEQLAQLRKALGSQKAQEDAEKEADLTALALAEKAARAGDRSGMLALLKSVGAWALDVATKIGVDLASSALKSASGLGS